MNTAKHPHHTPSPKPICARPGKATAVENNSIPPRFTALGKSTLILPAALISATSLGVVGLGMVFYARDVYGASATAIGFLAALPHLAYTIGCFAMRPLFRRLFPRHSILIASAAMAGALILILLTRSGTLLFLSYGIFGLADALFWPPLMGWASTGKEDRELNRTIARFNLMWSSGTFIGPLLGGFLVEYRPAAALQASALLFVLVALLAVVIPRLLPRVRQDRTREPSREPGGPPDRKGSLLRYPAWVGLFAGYVVIGIVISVFPLFARDVFGLPESRVGILLLLRTLFATIGFIVLGRTVFWHHRFAPMVAAQAGVILVLVLMIVLRGFLALGLMLAVLGLLVAMIYNSAIFHGMAGSRERTRRMSIQEAVLTAGVVTGSSLGGVVYQHSAMTGAIVFCLGTVAAGLAAQALLFLILRRRLGVPQPTGPAQ